MTVQSGYTNILMPILLNKLPICCMQMDGVKQCVCIYVIVSVHICVQECVGMSVAVSLIVIMAFN